MKKITILIIFLISKSVFSQTTFIVDNFSKEYYAKLFIADTSGVFSKGWVAVFDRKSKKQIIKINSEELTFDLHKGKVLANIKQLPYGEQSQIFYEDYNFDGVKDFAIMDGQNSCYHGPSFQIYLATMKSFKHSPEFTKLAQEYCGMFSVNYTSKTISTMTKSGCCWHQYSEFRVKDNKPYAIKIAEEGLSPSGITMDYEEQILVKGKMVKSKSQMLAVDIKEEDLVLSFEFENNKKMKVFKIETNLFYVFTDVDENVELLYYDIFEYSNLENTLSFSNFNTNYTIYDDKIIAETPKNTYNMKAVMDTKVGTLKKLNDLKMENVTN